MFKVIRDEVVIDINTRLPVLPLKEVVIFPYMIYPLLVGRESSLKAIEESMMLDKLIFLAAQKNIMVEEPLKEELYKFGVVARILQVLKLPNGLMKVLVEGVVRAKIKRFLAVEDHVQARIEVFDEIEPLTPQIKAKVRRVGSLFKKYVRLNQNIPDEVLLSIENVDQPQRFADFVAAHVQSGVKTKQQILENTSVEKELTEIIALLESEMEILEIERDLEDKVRDRIQKSQRTLYLQEQLRTIQDELDEDGEFNGEFAFLSEKVKKARMPMEAEEKAYEELEKLRNTPPFSPEATVIRNYLAWLLAVPWYQKSKDNLNIKDASRILDKDHFGLEKPKERILEHLAVLKLAKSMKGPLLCFVGPPGVGKTSLGKSVARAMGRNFVRVSLGGVRDEAEIRGHRRTYIGSMPGKVIESLKKAKTVNPVFLLDEVDKMSVDFRGDPSSALLEVLDPEQNKNFNDHYLEVDYDLSNVLFITTANLENQIPEPLQDRMEIINLPGYLEHEKIEIAKGFLIPKLLKQHGLKSKNLKFHKSAILKLIREYTREAGVRNLERELSAICRKVAREMVEKHQQETISISKENISKYLGVPKFPERQRTRQKLIGCALGVAWTRYGGDILQIEVNIMPGTGNLSLTGKLGDVMQESAKAALSYARTNAKKLGIQGEFWKQKDIHVHVPEGATPKDGPSAGITIAIALISALTNKQVRKDVAMTGEITLRGNVLAIGGLNEKLLAAQRSKIKTVIIPTENERELEEIPKEVKKGLNVLCVNHMDEVLKEVWV
ncbi:endopeptidase La [candidate division KSB1 bacterium]|nr:endopeptidase La [candidate division KSB1 bacterium]NIR73448.1 endopeptidase La [candidate division KSB1 bacterium]NIS27063.1 endopeptidase La [candidate division KSB1 bacterium]NIT73907.1 endopeptidase La [candidate division KSB1 bacterium]NIU27808.1 endopeptidase La [candidate division KSB1 bacterium]